ncbi:hypothetical protein Dimus_001842 [Dionaea muscipula]
MEEVGRPVTVCEVPWVRRLNGRRTKAEILLDSVGDGRIGNRLVVADGDVEAFGQLAGEVVAITNLAHRHRRRGLGEVMVASGGGWPETASGPREFVILFVLSRQSTPIAQVQAGTEASEKGVFKVIGF